MRNVPFAPTRARCYFALVIALTGPTSFATQLSGEEAELAAPSDWHHWVEEDDDRERAAGGRARMPDALLADSSLGVSLPAQDASSERLFESASRPALTTMTQEQWEAWKGVAITPELFFGPIVESVVGHDVSAPKDAFEFSYSKDGGRAALVLSHPVAQELLSLSFLTATLSAPIDKERDHTALFAGDRFANDAALELKFQRLSVRRPIPASLSPEVEAFIQNVGVTSLHPSNLAALSQRPFYERSTARALLWAPDSIRTGWGFKAKVGSYEHEFFPTDSLTRKSRHTIPWSAGGFLSWMPRGRVDRLFQLGADYVDETKAAKSKTLCPPLGGGNVLECVTGPYGEPTRRVKHLLSFEIRQVVGPALVSPRFSHDFKSGSLGFEMPIFLINNHVKEFSSGIRANWTEDDSWTFGLFVGKNFQIDSVP